MSGVQEAGAKVVDVDGSYLHRKQSASTSDFDPDPTPPAPLIGWECMDSAASVQAQNIPTVTHDKKAFIKSVLQTFNTVMHLL